VYLAIVKIWIYGPAAMRRAARWNQGRFGGRFCAA
jgi:hypothetical protein